MGALTLSVVQTDYDIILTCRGLAQYNVLRFHMKYVLFSHIYTRMQKKNFKIKIVIIWVGFFFEFAKLQLKEQNPIFLNYQ